MVIDFHTHFLPQAYPALPAGLVEPAWPRMVPTSDSTATMYVGEREFRSFDHLYWDVGQRVAALDRTGIAVQVMSPLPEVLSYWLEPRAAVVLTDAVNRVGADMAAASKGRLKAMGVVALQDVPSAVRQLEDLAAMGQVGVHLGSHVNGKSVADESHDPFFAAAERLGLLVFVHGIKPSGTERMLGSPLMAAVLGIPHENTMAVASFMNRDILGRFPQLKLVFSHGGGGIAAVIDRMTHVWNKFPAMQDTLKQPPLEYLRRFHYDTCVFSPDYLGYLVKRLGADRLVVGSDGPTEIGQTDLPGFVSRAVTDEATRTALLGGNAARLLGLPAAA